jgi:hypothetical protein
MSNSPLKQDPQFRYNIPDWAQDTSQNTGAQNTSGINTNLNTNFNWNAGSLLNNSTNTGTNMSSNTSLLNQNLIGGGANTGASNLGFNWNVPQTPTGDAAGGGGGPLGALSGFMEHAATPLGIGLSLASSVIGFRKARKAERKAKRRAKASERERQRQEEAYRNLDTSNPYLNMENVMEDLTINQKQAQFEKEQFQQSQANILDSLRGAAGGSGVAALAQQMAQSGQLASQRSAASIGEQERQNQMAERQMAGQLQSMEREGDVYSRGLKKEQTETLFGMAQQRAAADQTAVAQAKQAKMDAITGGITGAVDMFAGFGQ